MSIQISELHIELLRRYGRAIVHMRQLVLQRRLGVSLGAGISLDAGLPSWVELIKGITKRLNELGIQGPNLIEESPPIQAQILLSRFRQYLEAQSSFNDIQASHRDATVAAQWRGLLHKVLYKDIDNPDTLIQKHGYMEALAALAYHVPIVITYNFDDLLELALAKSSRKPNDTIGYYSAWGPSFVVQDNRPVVYHPNGYLPFNSIDRYSEQVILTEQSLSDQIIDSMMGSYALLLDYYSKAPCLFIGFSLSDPGLRSMLRQTARRSPGTVHYYIGSCPDVEPSKEEQAETTETNFDLFNMVTLYLGREQIRALLELIAQASDDDFNDACVSIGVATRYLHYIAGPVSVGKTTVISRLQGIDIVDEWLKPRDPLIAKPSIELKPVERERVDQWILEQLRLKNGRYKHARLGLHVMDRAPLDAFAFTPVEQHKEKAKKMYDIACAGATGTPQEFCPGKLIILKGRADDILIRQAWRGRGGTEQYISNQQTALLGVYQASNFGRIWEIETVGLTVETVVKKVLRAIHLEPYTEFNFSGRLRDYL